jgi:L-serine dehydratase
MNVFDIIGPVMVGPSSSHTAGAVRIGRIVGELLDEQPVDVVIGLHGSFARTYKGHGTDKAIIAGLMRMYPDDGRIRNSMELARKAGMEYRFEGVFLKDAHPNTAIIIAVGRTGKKITVQGSSVGGGRIIITKINDMDVEFAGEYNTLIISHKDTPGVVAAATDLLARRDINIANMKVYRSYRGGNAMMIIETDQKVSREQKVLIGCLPEIISVTLIEPN